MNRIDCNLMIGNGFKYRLNISNAEETMEAMAYFSIDRAVAYHAEARAYSPFTGNRRILALACKYPQIVPCFVVTPLYKRSSSGYSGLMECMKEENIRFARLFPREHGYSLGSPCVREMLDIFAECRTNLILDYGELTADGQCEQTWFMDLCKTYTQVNFILTCVPHRRNLMFYDLLERLDNLYLETSMIDNWRFYEDAVGRFGSERLLWGSNMPLRNAGSAITMLSYSEIPETDKENIAYKNLLRLMGV